jgi:2-polyprenyl-3-methyl-5-hydroxy-6-metoxy-1,4-benzoquinol methylase
MNVTDQSHSYEKRLELALQEFHATLFDQQSMKLKQECAEFTDCPVCYSSDSREVFVKDYFHYHRCNKCSMLYMNPRLNSKATVSFYNSNVNKIYNEKKFDAQTASTELDDSRNIENVKILTGFMSQNNITGKKLLEIGCAKGVFLKVAQDAGLNVHGLELNIENCDYANKLLGGNVHPIDLFEMKYPENSFDIVYMRDVIEHIHNPDHFLAEIARILRPGGIIYLETHNIDGLIYRAVGSKHTVIFGFEHPIHWSSKTITLALKNHKLEVKFIGYKSIDFFIRSLVKYFLQPTFTTVFLWQASPIKRFFLRALSFILSRPGFKQFDSIFFPRVANALGAGSTMKVIAVNSKN